MTRKSTTSAGDGREPGTVSGCLLAPHLQGWRLARGLTSVQLAAQTGVRFATVSRAENGHGLRRQTLDALAAALDVSVEALVSSEAPPAPPPPPNTALVLRTRSRARVPYRATPIRELQRTDPLYLRHLASFPTWLLAQQHRPDRIGAIARVADNDPALRRQAAEGSASHRPVAPDLREAWAARCRWRRNQLRHHQ